MRLSIVIPGNNFEVFWAESQDFVPTFEPQEVRWKDPILTIRNFL